MTHCFFASDLHGSSHRYRALFEAMERDRPAAVFLGGDLLPPSFAQWKSDRSIDGSFVGGFLAPSFRSLQTKLGPAYPRVFLILGNDDLREVENEVVDIEGEGLWRYVHGGRAELGEFQIYGYAFVPPTPFLWKDWERYDVSRYVPPGCVSPEEGWRTVESRPAGSEVRHHQRRPGSPNRRG